jgi:hypothetical protein
LWKHLESCWEHLGEQKKSSSLQDPIHKRRLGMHDYGVTSDNLPGTC